MAPDKLVGREEVSDTVDPSELYRKKINSSRKKSDRPVIAPHYRVANYHSLTCKCK